jgi:hypothetical protein
VRARCRSPLAHNPCPALDVVRPRGAQVIGLPGVILPPNAAWPSDHIALMAEFQVMPSQGR